MLAARQLKIVQNSPQLIHIPRRGRGKTVCDVADNFAALATPIYLAKGVVLFAEGQPARGVFFVYSGCVKLFTSSADGKTLILRFAGPREVLGLGEALAGRPYEVWAEATEATESGFVRRDDLVRFMHRDSEIAVKMAMQLGESYSSAIDRVRLMGHSRSASQKLARFLLDWCKRSEPLHDESVARFALTHESIGQVTGSSRETVTRVLSAFKRKGLIQWEGCNLVLRDRTALERSAGS